MKVAKLPAASELERMGVSLMSWSLFGGDRNVLKLDCSDSCTLLLIYLNILSYIKWWNYVSI